MDPGLMKRVHLLLWNLGNFILGSSVLCISSFGALHYVVLCFRCLSA